MYNELRCAKKEKRVYNHANLLLNQNLTVREISNITGYSKSTVHRDLCMLRNHDELLYIKTKSVLNRHRFEQKHKKR